MTEQTPISADQMFEATLRSRLALAPGLADVHATVTGAVATLTGTVREEIDIRRAVLIAQAVEGLSSEVQEKMQVADASQGEQNGHFDPLADIGSNPTTRVAAEDLSPIDEGLNPPTEADKDNLVSLIQEGMEVFDSEGKKVGKVKDVRPSDFLLTRLLAKNYYVPLIACTTNAEGVHLNVKGDEMKDQGWASPHLDTA